MVANILYFLLLLFLIGSAIYLFFVNKHEGWRNFILFAVIFILCVVGCKAVSIFFQVPISHTLSLTKEMKVFEYILVAVCAVYLFVSGELNVESFKKDFSDLRKPKITPIKKEEEHYDSTAEMRKMREERLKKQKEKQEKIEEKNEEEQEDTED